MECDSGDFYELMDCNYSCHNCTQLKKENLRLRRKILNLEQMHTDSYPEYLDLEILNLQRRIRFISKYMNHIKKLN